MPMTSGIAAFGVLSSRAQAAATAKVPTVPVACQPPSREMVGAARDIRPQISAPMMKAARISDGDDFSVSAIGRMAGISPAIDCPT